MKLVFDDDEPKKQAKPAKRAEDAPAPAEKHKRTASVSSQAQGALTRARAAATVPGLVATRKPDLKRKQAPAAQPKAKQQAVSSQVAKPDTKVGFSPVCAAPLCPSERHAAHSGEGSSESGRFSTRATPPRSTWAAAETLLRM
jgi:hypothetical protein